jgi:hypothetical protein
MAFTCEIELPIGSYSARAIECKPTPGSLGCLCSRRKGKSRPWIPTSTYPQKSGAWDAGCCRWSRIASGSEPPTTGKGNKPVFS